MIKPKIQMMKILLLWYIDDGHEPAELETTSRPRSANAGAGVKKI